MRQALWVLGLVACTTNPTAPTDDTDTTDTDTLDTDRGDTDTEGPDETGETGTAPSGAQAGDDAEAFGGTGEPYLPSFEALRGARFGLYGLPRHGPPLREGCVPANASSWICCEVFPLSSCWGLSVSPGSFPRPRLLRTAANCLDEPEVLREEEVAPGCPVAAAVLEGDRPRECLRDPREASPRYLGAVLPWGPPETYDWCRREPRELWSEPASTPRPRGLDAWFRRYVPRRRASIWVA